MSDSPQPLVSVGIPTYNQPAFLRQAIQSVLVQDWNNLEVIVVDDCSTDNTPDVVRQFKDPRVQYHRTQRNLRPPASWNICAGLARGEFFALLPHDDVYMPGFLRAMTSALGEHPDLGFSQCAYYAVDEHLRPTELRRASQARVTVRGEDAVIWQSEFYFCNPVSLLFRRSRLAELGFWDEHYWDDIVLILRTAFHYGFIYMPDAYACVRVHETNLSKQLVKENDDLMANVIDQQAALFAGILPMTERLLELRHQMSRSLSFSCIFHTLRALRAGDIKRARMYYRRARNLHHLPLLDPGLLRHFVKGLAQRRGITRWAVGSNPVAVFDEERLLRLDQPK